MKAKVTIGSHYVGNDRETIEYDVDDKDEFQSDEFSTRILQAIESGEFPHYYIEYELFDDNGNEVSTWQD